MPAGTAQQVDVATAFMAVAEVVAHQEPSRVKAFNQQVAYEGVSGHGCKFTIEANEYNLLDLVLCQSMQFVTQGADLGRDHLRPVAQARKIRPRMWRKGHHGGRQLTACGYIAQTLQYGLMPQVHAVKVANGDGTGAPRVITRQGAINS